MASTASNTTEDAVEVELGITDRDCFFVRASAELSCRVFLEDLFHRSDGDLLEFFTIQDASAERIREMAAAASAISDVRLVREEDAGNLFEFVVAGPCVITTLADMGAIARSVQADHGRGRIVADVPAHIDLRSVVESFQTEYPDSELIARRPRKHSVRVRSEPGARATLANQLTVKQFEVLKLAYRSGYFDWPRKSSADECAEALGIAQSTFSQHIRAAQHRLFEALFDPESE